MNIEELLPPDVLKDLNEANERIQRVYEYVESLKGKSAVRRDFGKYHGREGEIGSAGLFLSSEGKIVPGVIIYPYKEEGGTLLWNHYIKSYLRPDDFSFKTCLWKEWKDSPEDYPEFETECDDLRNGLDATKGYTFLPEDKGIHFCGNCGRKIVFKREGK